METEKRWYIGVDGGGTKTAVGLYDSEGNECRSVLCPPLNYHVIGVDAALSHLREGIEALGIPAEQVTAVGIGDPAIDDVSDSAAARRFAAAARQMLKCPVLIRSDAYMTLYGLTRGTCPGVLVISGTGSMAIAENAEGRLFVSGGWGRLTADEGSGYYIGLEGIRAALHAADGISSPTALLSAALRYFDVPTPRDLIGRFYGDPEPDVAGFSRCVADCAAAGDDNAEAILWDAAQYLARYASALIEQSGAGLVGIYGSVLTKNHTVRDAFSDYLHARYPQITITEPPINAQAAAALYAAKYAKEERES